MNVVLIVEEYLLPEIVMLVEPRSGKHKVKHVPGFDRSVPGPSMHGPVIVNKNVPRFRHRCNSPHGTRCFRRVVVGVLSALAFVGGGYELGGTEGICYLVEGDEHVQAVGGGSREGPGKRGRPSWRGGIRELVVILGGGEFATLLLYLPGARIGPWT